MQGCSVSGCDLGIAHVGRDYRQVRDVLAAEVSPDDRLCRQVVNGDIEKSLNLLRVQVQSKHPVGARRGYEVGPEITRNGRGSFEQLIVSVFDPSLVIGEAYKSVSVLTTDGRLISGLVTERSNQRIVLKVQGGKLEVIPIDEADEIRDNDQSLMPEGLETQMTRQEMADLFALLSLEQPPETSAAQVIAGPPDGLHVKP